MDIEIIKALAGLPVEVVLIFIIINQQKQITSLLAQVISLTQNHAENMLRFAMTDREVQKRLDDCLGNKSAT